MKRWAEQVQTAILEAKAAAGGRRAAAAAAENGGAGPPTSNGVGGHGAAAGTPRAPGSATARSAMARSSSGLFARAASGGVPAPLAEGAETALLYVRFRAAAEPGLKGACAPPRISCRVLGLKLQVSCTFRLGHLSADVRMLLPVGDGPRGLYPAPAEG